MSKRPRVGRRHVFIPDPQVKPNVNTDHLEAAGNYIVDQRPDVIVVAGDHADMPSLSSYEGKGSKYFHDKSYRADIDSANDGFARLMRPIKKEIDRRRNGHRQHWNPELHFTLGNHEERILRAIHNDPVLAGTLSLDDLDYAKWGFTVHPFLKIVNLDGVLYSHYFVNQDSLTKNVLGGTIENRLKSIGASFTMGHQQIRKFGSRYNASGREQMGLVAGAFYSHDEDYMGPQGNNYWRGIVVKNEVREGSYDPLFVSLNYLVREWL